MAKRPTVPKFGTWDKDNVGYTIYFDKVRENKGGATAPPLQHRPYNPNDPEDGPLRAVPPPSSRPSTAGGRPNGQAQAHHHRRAGSTSSEPGGRGAEQSKFAPPPQYNPRPSHQQAPQHNQHHAGGGHRHHPSPPGHAGGGGGSGHRGQQAPRQQYHHQQQPAPRARSASPQYNVPNNRQRPSAAVPKFGVWDEQSAASAAQGFTVQFERVKRDRDVARAGGVPKVPSPPPLPEPRRSHRDSPFFSKMFGCFRPTD